MNFKFLHSWQLSTRYQKEEVPLRALIRFFDFLDIVNSYRKLEEATRGYVVKKVWRRNENIENCVRKQIKLYLRTEMLKIIKISLNKIKYSI